MKRESNYFRCICDHNVNHVQGSKDVLICGHHYGQYGYPGVPVQAPLYDGVPHGLLMFR